MYTHGADNLSSIDTLLRGKRLGLITNPSGLDSRFRSTVSRLAERYRLVRLYAPEHGIRGEIQAGGEVKDYVDRETGIFVSSMFNDREMELSGVDLVLYDIQDIGLRYYTYPYVLGRAMAACEKAGVGLVILDRYDPLGLTKLEGTVLRPEFDSGVGQFRLPARYAMTVGELGQYLRGEYYPGCALTVVPCTGLTRKEDAASLRLPWVLPSPNLPTFESTLCYIGTVFFEGTNLSEGRGTTTPFRTVGAPWLDAERTLRALADLSFPGIAVRRVYFTPTFSKYQGEVCEGLFFHVTDRNSFPAFRFGVTLIKLIERLHSEFQYGPGFDRLAGTDALRQVSLEGLPAYLEAETVKCADFAKKTEKYRIYPE